MVEYPGRLKVFLGFRCVSVMIPTSIECSCRKEESSIFFAPMEQAFQFIIFNGLVPILDDKRTEHLDLLEFRFTAAESVGHVDENLHQLRVGVKRA